MRLDDVANVIGVRSLRRSLIAIVTSGLLGVSAAGTTDRSTGHCLREGEIGG